MSAREEFLAGERPDDVYVFLHERAVSETDALAEVGERTAEGVSLVVAGDRGRQAFRSATGIDPMAFAKEAMGTTGTVDRDLTGGVCPASADGEGNHEARLIFAFAQAETEEVDGLYTEGDVIHAYVACECGERYSERWLAGE